MKSILILAGFILLTSCSTRIGVRTPSTKFISPEAIGQSLKGEITMYNARGTTASVDLTENTADNSLELSDTSDNDDFLGVNGEVGIFEKMDLVIFKPGSSSPIMGGVKYQIMGAPRLATKAGNHSLSIVAMAGTGTKDDKNDDRIELTPQDDEVETTLNMFSTNASLIYGYRLSNTVLAYAGGTYGTMKFDGELESSNNTTLDGEDVDYEGYTNEANVGVMFELGRLITLKLEGSNQKVKWEKTSEKTFNYFSVGLGFNWY